MKNILITGGAGFLGSHLAQRLLQQKNINVIAIDNFVTSDFYNIEDFVRLPNFEFLKLDVAEQFDLDKFDELKKFKIKIYGIEEIYHLACPTSPKDYDTLPLQTCLANSHATKNVLTIAKTYQSTFLFASTSAVYGLVLPKEQPVKETQWGKLETLGPRSCYADGKRFAENLIIYYAAENNFTAKIARIFTTYGPKMRLNDGRIIPDFITAAIEGKNIKIPGGPKIASTFCYVDDMIDGLIKMMAADISTPFNLGGEQLYTLDSAAKMIIDILKSKSQIIYDKEIPYRDPLPIPDISMAKEHLDWIPITPLEQGLIKTAKAMRASKIVKFGDVNIKAGIHA